MSQVATISKNESARTFAQRYSLSDRSRFEGNNEESRDDFARESHGQVAGGDGFDALCRRVDGILADVIFHTDFRRIYADILAKHLGIDPAAILGPGFDPLGVLG